MSGIAKYKLLALDSNIFIYHFEDRPVFADYTQIIFDRLSQNLTKAVTSVVSVIETLSYPLPKTTLKQIETKFKTIPNFTILNVDEEIALEAARIRREYKYRLPDAVQLATAIHSKCKVFVTNDNRLKGFKGIDIIQLTDIK